MGETTTNTSGACELVLDYVYGELDDERKRAFEEHLPNCGKCQQEVASFGRVRTAAKRVMPAVEPTAPLGGALHAQLMHAAAQRKPRRGVLLSFPRKIVEHPALSAAAMFVLVGGAFAINWSRGKLAMAPTETAAKQAELEAPKAEPAAPPAVTIDTPKPTEAAPVIPEPKAKEEVAENELAKLGDREGAADKTQFALQTPKGSYAVTRPAAHHAATTAPPKKEAPARMKSIAVDGKLAKYDNASAAGKDLDDGLAANNGPGNGRGVVGGVAGGGGEGTRFGAKGSAKSSAPAAADESESAVLAEKAPSREEQKSRAPEAGRSHGYATGATTNAPAATAPPPPAAPMPQTASTPASERDYRAAAQNQRAQAPVAKPASSTRNFEVTRKQADEWAKSGRCDEAIKAYEELDKSKQYISPTERANWSRCLMQRGRQEEAQQRLDDLKNNDSRRKVEASKKAKKAPPADRAPASNAEVQQQRAAEPAPAQAAPPDSTNTKVKPSSAY